MIKKVTVVILTTGLYYLSILAVIFTLAVYGVIDVIDDSIDFDTYYWGEVIYEDVEDKNGTSRFNKIFVPDDRYIAFDTYSKSLYYKGILEVILDGEITVLEAEQIAKSVGGELVGYVNSGSNGRYINKIHVDTGVVDEKAKDADEMQWIRRKITKRNNVKNVRFVVPQEIKLNDDGRYEPKERNDIYDGYRT